MIAAKAMDPVVGIDIHIIQPPGPVPPVPIPHPFIGLLIDPMDFAPIIGATVMVNGMPRATAGTGGKCVPSHIPIGGTFIKPPGNECEVFMGSSTVLADADPLSFLGMPALSCHDIGMPPPPRLKKKRTPKSLVLPTSVVMAIPAGPPVLVGGPPTISMMALGMRAGMAGLGRLRRLQRGSRRMRGVSDRIQAAARRGMDRLGVPPSVQNRVHRAICTATGHPVDVATGKVFTEAVDFELPGPIPFRWERVWYSCSTYQGPLGRGWHHTYDVALLEEDGAVAVRLADGRAVAFPALAAGEDHSDRSEGLKLLRDERGYALQDLAGLTWRFAPLAPQNPVQPLNSLEDPNGNALRFAYNVRGHLTGITDSAGRELSLSLDDTGRITALRVPHPEHRDRSFIAAGFHYDGDGHLVEVRDADGFVRRFRYHEGLLVQEVDRNGYSFHFEYGRIGPLMRCTATWGDGGLYARRLRYDLAAGQTAVVDSRGATTLYHWNDRGLVTREVDALGGVTRTQWDEDGKKRASENASGEKTRYDYDADGRLLVLHEANGGQTQFTYDPVGNLSAFTDPAASAWTRTLDSRRNVTGITDPVGGQWTFDVNAQGLAEEVGDPGGKVTRFSWDRSGNLRSRTSPAGSELRLRHDRLGRPVEQIDEEGRTSRLVWTLRGLLSQVTDAAGRVQRFAHDGEGNTIGFDDGHGTRRYEYGPQGALLAIHDPGGRVTRYRYDTEGALIGIEDTAGHEWTLERDILGRILLEVDPFHRRRHFEHDVGGRLRAYRDEWGQTVDLAYHPGGLLKSRRYADGTEERFEYDPVGRLVKAENAVCTVHCQYDPLGRLVGEASDSGSHLASYDPTGRLVARHADGGGTFRWEYHPDGQVSGISMDDAALLSVDGEQRGRERTSHFPGEVFRHDVFDAAGRIARSRVVASGNELLAREFSYDAAGRVEEVWDRNLGGVRYERDRDGALVRATDAQGDDRFAPDPDAWRTLTVPGSVASYSGPHVLTLDFDGSGHLIRKSGGAAWRYRYDAAGRLARVDGDSGQPAVTFRYDALGRRVEKRCGEKIVQYVWFGETIWREHQQNGAEGGTIDYLWEPGTFRPIASVSQDRTLFFHCDGLGTPWAASDAGGSIGWTGIPGATGAMREERGDPTAVPFRFPGQHWDSETGLHYNRFRYYDPEFGAYITPDPIGVLGGSMPYAYVPDPLAWTDPYGLAARRVCGTPGCNNCARPQDTLVRRGSAAESAESLAGQARAAEKAGFPHGVSVTTPAAHQRRAPELNYDPDDASRATREAFEDAGFPVHHTPTKPDPQHHTVELPQDVTPEVADRFNSVLGRE